MWWVWVLPACAVGGGGENVGETAHTHTLTRARARNSFWVLVDGDYQLHALSEGVARTSSERYDASRLHDRLIHLTNHCIQATGPSYSSHER